MDFTRFHKLLSEWQLCLDARDATASKKAINNYLLFWPSCLNIWIIFGHQNLTKYWIEYHYLEPTQLFKYSNNSNYLFKLWWGIQFWNWRCNAGIKGWSLKFPNFTGVSGLYLWKSPVKFGNFNDHPLPSKRVRSSFSIPEVNSWLHR